MKHRSIKDGLLTDETLFRSMEDVFGESLNEEFRGDIWRQLGIGKGEFF